MPTDVQGSGSRRHTENDDDEVLLSLGLMDRAAAGPTRHVHFPSICHPSEQGSGMESMDRVRYTFFSTLKDPIYIQKMYRSL